MSQYIVSFSVVTYNSEQYIGRLLDAIFTYVKGVDYHIYVIDNGSSDDTVNIVKSKGSRITLLRPQKNLGFGAAHNMVLDRLNSKYHVITNPDIFFDYDTITLMAHYLDNNNDIGMVSPKILFPDGRVQVQAKRDPKLIYLFSRRLDVKILRKYRNLYEMNASGYDQAYDIEFASGCFMFLRTELFKRTHGFDTRYFLYFEDADLSRKVRRYARVEYNPSYHVYHNWERGGAKDVRLFFMQVVSMVKYLRKWRKDHQ